MVLQSIILFSPFSPDLRKNMSLLFLMKIIIFVMVAKYINEFLCIKLWWVISLETVEGIHSKYIIWDSESLSENDFNERQRMSLKGNWSLCKIQQEVGALKQEDICSLLSSLEGANEMWMDSREWWLKGK